MPKKGQKPPFTALVVETRVINKETMETKEFKHPVGVGFPVLDGKGVKVLIPEGISVTGTLLILPNEEEKPKK
jgi:hypothetical protein